MTDDVAYILSDSECRIVFAEDDAQIAKLREKKSELPHVEKVVTFEGTADGDWVIGLADLEKLGEELLNENGSAVQERIDGTDGDSLATLIYTSGTTGRPKGVRLRHKSWTYEGAAIQAQGILTEDDLQFLWLPMAHSFGKVLLSTQLAIGFATAVDGRVEKIIENLAVVKPTFMGAAPRIFEKAHGRIMTMQAQEGGAEGEDLQRRLLRRQAGRGSARPRARASRRTSRCCTGCSTSWSSARSASASEDGSGSSSPARPRSTVRSRSGSTSPASSSSRATA